MDLFLLQLQRRERLDVALALAIAHVGVAVERDDAFLVLALDAPAEAVVAVLGIIRGPEVGERPLAALRHHHRRLHLQPEQAAVLEAHLTTEAVVGAVAQTIDQPMALELLHDQADGHRFQRRIFLQRQRVGHRTD